MSRSGRWHYIAQRLDGNGSLGEFIDFNVPLKNVEIEDVLSGHNSLTATISPEFLRMKAPTGNTLLHEWDCAIWAEDPDGQIRGGGILTHSGFDGPNWTIECSGLTFSSVNLPYTGADHWVNVDPIDIFRHIWTYIQSQPGGNLGIQVDPTRSPILVGGDLIQRVEFDTEDDPSAGLEPVPTAPNRFANNTDWRERGVKVMKAAGWKPDVVDDALRKWLQKDSLKEAGRWPKGGLTTKEETIKKRVIEKIGLPPNPPSGTVKQPPPVTNDPPGEETPIEWVHDAYKLNWYTNHDLSADIDDLAELTPFDWHLVSRWEDDEIRHRLRVGYPKLGRRRDELRFVVGENIKVVPSIERDGTEYANEVLFLGAGEGSTQIMGRAFRPDGRVRRVAVVSDTSVQTNAMASVRAQQELAKRNIVEDITDIVLMDHKHAPMGSVDIGDEILIEGETGWADLEVWCRVVARRISPDTGNAMSLTLIRSDRLK